MARLSGWLLLAVLIGSAAFACHHRVSSRFPHRLHLVDIPCGAPEQPACLDCTSCHGAPVEARGLPPPSEGSREPVLPGVERCEECHQDRAADLLTTTMRGAMEQEPVAHAIRFDHQRHLAMEPVRGQCMYCHQGAVDSQVPDTPNSSQLFPAMARCFQCHEHQQQFDRGQCTPCHDALEVRSLIPQSFVAHNQTWKRHHENEAFANPALCQSCHAQQQCDDCHNMGQKLLLEVRRPEATSRVWTHPADFLTRHAMEARSTPGQCMSCHTAPSCDGCHLERGISAIAVDARSPHPPGWVGGNPASRNFHGRAARRDLFSCAACHDQGPRTNCIQCHRVGGSGGNPHPSGTWTQRSPSDRMCRYCHEP